MRIKNYKVPFKGYNALYRVTLPPCMMLSSNLVFKICHAYQRKRRNHGTQNAAMGSECGP